MFKTLKSKLAAVVAAVAVVLSFGAQNAQAAYDIVTSDSNGNVSFVPSALSGPIITAVIAAVGSAAALFVIALGVRWLYKMMRGSK